MKRLVISLMVLVITVAFAGLSTAAEKQSESSASEGMIFVKGGCFQMGDTLGDGYKDERPVHEVCVNDFYIGKYEVTQGQWKEVMGNNPSYYKERDNYPVENVSWNDVQEFIKKLNQKTGKKYRLPTEAEWEYAARSGGKKERFAGFSNESDLYKYANFCDVNCDWNWKTNGQDDGYKNTSPVGSYNPNGLGLYDMSGNVYEWVADWYSEYYYKRSPKYNPKAKGSHSSGGYPYRVRRGGSWYHEPGNMRVAYRYSAYLDTRSNYVGFRLVVSQE